MMMENTNHGEIYHKPKYQLLEKQTLVGPVTALSLETCSTIDRLGNKVNVDLCLVARGPYVNIVPLHKPDTGTGTKTGTSADSDTHNDTFSEVKEDITDSNDDAVNNDPDLHMKNKSFTHLAFGRRDVDSGTVHGIHKVSSYHFNTSTDEDETENGCKTKSNTLSIWAFYGSRKLSFALIDVASLTKENVHNLKEDSSVSSTIHIEIDNENCKKRKTSLTKAISTQQNRPYLSLTDWVWDVRVIARDVKTDVNVNVDVSTSSKKLNLLTAIGMAQNVVEVWSLSSTRSSSYKIKKGQGDDNVPTLRPIKLRKIICDKRCITYSLSFFGWKDNFNDSHHQNSASARNGTGLNGDDLSLAVAVGTVSNQILVWNAIDESDGKQILHECNTSIERDDTNTSESANIAVIMSRKKVSHTLSGHLGVIYSCKFGLRGAYIASTSDDRTVRLWKRNNQDENKSHKGAINDPYEIPSDVRMITNSEECNYILQWTGFSHAARVWDCDFISLPNDTGSHTSFGGVITSGEDATLKVWNMEDGSLLSTLKGHACQSIWKVCSAEKRIKNTDSSFAVSGANDGSINIWNIPYHLSNCDTKCQKLILSEKQKIMCGMCFYPTNPEKYLLVATRDGTMNTLDLETQQWIQHGLWTCSEGEDDIIKAEYGSCLAIHPSRLIALIGTTKGDVVLCSIQKLHQEKVICSGKKYLAAQSLCWLDDMNFLVFHVKGIVVWWEVNSFSHSQVDGKDVSNCMPRIIRVFNMKTGSITIGVSMSHSYDQERELMFIGDSRGNIAAFNCKNISSDEGGEIVEQIPTDLLVYAHKKEHVTSIIPTSDGRGILSVGNDGRLHESTIVGEGDSMKFQRSLSRPVSNLTGVSYLWRSDSGAVIAGGYHGNEFVIVDVTTNRRLLSVDSGGRARRIAVSIQLQNTASLTYKLAVCVVNKKKPLEIIIHSSPSKLPQYLPSLPYALEVPYHGETVLDIAMCNLGGEILLLSGSNDCSVKLSSITNSSISLIKELPPHETCIRALCFTRHKESSSAIIVVCGGKLITTFYRLDKYGSGEISVHFLCTNKLLIKPSIDHRINAVKAIPSLKSINSSSHPSHIVLAGDSDGGLHLSKITEELGQSRKLISHLLTQGKLSDSLFIILILNISEF
jgi:WD40 repeat protein